MQQFKGTQLIISLKCCLIRCDRKDLAADQGCLHAHVLDDFQESSFEWKPGDNLQWQIPSEMLPVLEFQGRLLLAAGSIDEGLL